MIDDGDDGARVVRLYLPFEFNKKKIDRVTIKAVQLDHVMRWQAGEFNRALSFLASLTGMQETCLRMLRYPDADRVIAAFLEMLPAEIRNQVAAGEVPLPAPSVAREEQAWGPVPQPLAPEMPQPPEQSPSSSPEDDGGGIDIGDH